MKLKHLLVAVLASAAVLSTPFLALGQTTDRTVDHAQAEQLRRATVNLMASRNGLGSDWSTNADYLTREATVMQLCRDLGTDIYAITNGQESSVWSRPSVQCTVGRVDPGRTSDPEDLLSLPPYSRGHVAFGPLTTLGQRVIGLSSRPNDPPITQESYQQINRQSNDAGGNGVNPLSQFLTYIVEGLASIVSSILAMFATLSLKALASVVDLATTSQTPGIVNRGWVIIRDFMNLFFIVALIAMALATILRFESYNYRQILPRLIFMAILINFSKLISETLVDFSDMIISMFNPREGVLQMASVIFDSFVLGGGDWTNFFGQGRGVTEALGNSITKLVGLTVITISFAAVALLMFVRLIGLWFLVMVSPVAYALNILPNTKQYASQWWGTFIKYLVWGPVAMFFFRLSFTLMRENAGNMFSDHILNNLFIAAFVYAGYRVAKASGMIGSAAIIAGAEKAFSKAKGYGTSAVTSTVGGAGLLAGNYAWRGTAVGHVAGTGKYLGRLAQGDSHDEARKAGRETKENVRDAVGGFTARRTNAVGLIKQKYIDQPNADRKKLVEKERRRSVIRRDYLKDFDEDTAKKVTADDYAYMLKHAPDKLSDGKINNLMEHAPESTKLAVAASFRDGKVKEIVEKYKKMTDEQVNESFERVREFAWKKKGRELSDLAKHPDFMSQTATYIPKEGDANYELDSSGKVIAKPTIERDVVITKKTGNFDPKAELDHRLKNGYVKIDPENVFAKDKKVTKKTDRMRNNAFAGVLDQDGNLKKEDNAFSDLLDKDGNIKKAA